MSGAIEKLASETLEAKVVTLGAQIRQRRKAWGVSVLTAAEAAGMSRDTWHRMEKGETTVTIGAWFNALSVLGLEFGIGMAESGEQERPPGHLPVTIRLSDFPQLAALAWQVPDKSELSPREALDIYERNARFLEPESLSPEERDLLGQLKMVLGSSIDV